MTLNIFNFKIFKNNNFVFKGRRSILNKRLIEDSDSISQHQDHFDIVNRYSSFNLMNYDQIYLATKSNYYQLNTNQISQLTKNLLFKNALLNQELEILYPEIYDHLNNSSYDKASNILMDNCIENEFDHDFIVKILWQRIYIEPIAMKFISMRYSNYANNLHISKSEKSNRRYDLKRSISSDLIPYFPYM